MFAEPLNSLPLPFVALASKPEELALLTSGSAMTQQQQGGHKADWDQRGWEWDPVRFLAQPRVNGEKSEESVCRAAEAAEPDPGPHLFHQGCAREPMVEQEFLSRDSLSPEPCTGLDLKLGGSSFSFAAAEESGSRNMKRYRASSPGAQFPTCQVDDCKADLRLSKDYHRRHKVCEPHSKASKAIVAHQPQRFCQQCSRFHPLAEFDEGKRSCRRRLAGHNRRRRKTQPDAAAAQAYLLAETDYAATKGGLITFLQMLHQLQASSALEGLNGVIGSRDALLHYYNRACMSATANLNGKPNNGGGHDACYVPPPPNADAGGGLEKHLLSAALSGLAQDKLSQLLQSSVKGQRGQDLFTGSFALAPAAREQAPAAAMFGEQVSLSPPSSCAGGGSKPGEVARLSTMSGEPFVDASQGWSKTTPVAHRLFPLQSSMESHSSMNGKPAADANGHSMISFLDGQANGPSPHLELQQPSAQKTSENSSSGSDRSLEGSNADSQDLVGRISFKLFDKNPGDFPHMLRTQILEWLAHRPSDIESYIRPGCVILTVFLSLPGQAWEELCRSLGWSLRPLLEASLSDFWSKGRIQVQVNHHSVVIVDGKVQRFHVLRPLCPPQILSVRPIAIVSDQKTKLVLRGYNLHNLGSRVICSYQGKSTVGQTLSLEPGELAGMDRGEGSGGQSVPFGDWCAFQCGPFPSNGRCFVEVEQGACKGNSLPVVVADSSVCAEIRTLEDEVETASLKAAKLAQENGLLQDEVLDYANTARAVLEADVSNFLFELGWLFQRRGSLKLGASYGCPKTMSSRCQRLFVFSVGRDWCAVVKKLLDLYFDATLEFADNVAATAALTEGVTLLHRAVKRNCRPMVELLLAYSPKLLGSVPDGWAAADSMEDARVPIFTPDLPGLMGVTPLHIAASMQDAEAVIDALTSDVDQIGIQAWSNARDASGQTPLNCAIAGGKFIYVQLVRSKVARLQSQSLWRPRHASRGSMAGQGALLQVTSEVKSSPNHNGSSSRNPPRQCRLVTHRRAPIGGMRGKAHRSLVLCMVAVACVCVVVCLLLKGPPTAGVANPFTWRSLGIGPK